MARGNPKYEPTEADRNTVKSMAATGFTHEEIASCLGTAGIDPKTMRKHFRVELATAANKANAAGGEKPPGMNTLDQMAQPWSPLKRPAHCWRAPPAPGPPRTPMRRQSKS